MTRIMTRRSGVIGSTRKRQTEWSLCSVPTGYTSVPAGAKVILVLVPAVTLAADSPSTIVRTRGLLSIESDQRAASESQIGAFGIGFVNVVAGALGITALPGPASECSWGGWFLHQFFSYRVSVTTDIGVEPNFAHPIELDSKAMRKFTEDESLLLMIENFGATGFNAAVSFRMLLKAG